MRIALSNRIIGALLASSAALLAAGCDSEPLAPSAVAGTYVLQSIDGNPLPTDAGYQGAADGSITVIADTLRLAADGTGSTVRIEETVSDPGSGESTRARFESELHFTTSDDGISITFECPINALMLCIEGPHMAARLSATGLNAVRLQTSPRTELAYARVERLE